MISFLNTFFTSLTSLGLHTIASKFAFLANIACFNTTLFIFPLYPISLRDLLSKDVRVVTPINLTLPATFLVACNASNPQFMWIVT